MFSAVLTLLQCVDTHTQVKMAVSRKLCGAVIGQKGQTIRDFMLDSGATIRVQVGAARGGSRGGGRGGVVRVLVLKMRFGCAARIRTFC